MRNTLTDEILPFFALSYQEQSRQCARATHHCRWFRHPHHTQPSPVYCYV